MKQIYIKLYQKNTRGDGTKTYQLFAVPIGNAKTTGETRFHPSAPVLRYHKKEYNSCCLSSLVSAFHSIGDNRALTAIVDRIEESLTLQTYKFRNLIYFDNAMMTNGMHIKGENRLRYNLKVWQKNDAFLFTK